RPASVLRTTNNHVKAMLDIAPATLIPADAPVTETPNLPALGDKTTMHAILVGDRIDTTALERDEKLPSVSALPLRVRAGAKGLAVVFRYGVVVFIGLTSAEQSEFLKNLRSRIAGPLRARDREEETASVEISAEREDQIPPGGPIYVRDMAIERLLLAPHSLPAPAVLSPTHPQR